MDILDPNKKCVMRLFRNSCTIHQGYLIKDLTRITKNLKDILIVDVITIRIYIR